MNFDRKKIEHATLIAAFSMIGLLFIGAIAVMIIYGPEAIYPQTPAAVPSYPVY